MSGRLTNRAWRRRARRRARHLPTILGAGLGLALTLAGCAGGQYADPYAESVSVPGDRERGEPAPDAAAAQALVRVALATRAAGDYASAINVFKRAHGLAPHDAGIMLELGETLAAVGAYNEARAVLVKAVKAAPKETRAIRGLANALVGLGEPALATTRYREALALRPEAATHNGLGVALDALGDGDGAEAAYRAGLALESDNAHLIGNLGLSLALAGRTEEAIELIAPQIRLGRSTPRLRQNLALVYGLAGRMDDARTVLRMDLDEGAVRNNLAYYEMLRGLDPDRRRESVLGVRAVVAGEATAAVRTVPAGTRDDAAPAAPPTP